MIKKNRPPMSSSEKKWWIIGLVILTIVVFLNRCQLNQKQSQSPNHINHHQNSIFIDDVTSQHQ